MILSIYTLTPTEYGDTLTHSGQDTVRLAVVAARSSDRARKLAEQKARMDEPEGFFLRPDLAKLRKIGECTPGTQQKERLIAREDTAW